jgi:hypothetical protein
MNFIKIVKKDIMNSNSENERGKRVKKNSKLISKRYRERKKMEDSDLDKRLEEMRNLNDELKTKVKILKDCVDQLKMAICNPMKNTN